VTTQYGADILRLWVMNSDTALDLRIGPEILKQQAELYRRIRNTLRWLLGSLDGFTDAETVAYTDLPELERWVLHRVSELDARMREAASSYDWSGVVPALHDFCNSDLSAFYFDIRKDALYCDAPDSLRRRSARTVLDILHRCLCAWFAPVLAFTAEEAWLARFPDEEGSIHLLDFPFVPEGWRDAALAEKWVRVRAIRRRITGVLESMRQTGDLKGSLQAKLTLYGKSGDALLLDDASWAEVGIVSTTKTAIDVDLKVVDGVQHGFFPDGEPTVMYSLETATGTKCDRCWRVLPEVGLSPVHPTLCRRCEAVVTA
ncbi:MAG: class I tRNA ligase family protein, partial [Pseudomonadota bacterium]